MSSLAIVLGALGDTVLLEPCLRALAQAAPPLEVWGPAAGRLLPLLAPRGPAARARAWPPEALGLWGEGPLEPALEAGLRAARLVAFTAEQGPLAARVRALGGAVVAPPRRGQAGGPHALEHLAAGLRAATGLLAEGPPRLSPLADDAARGQALAGARDYVVVHPGAGAIGRRWPQARFLGLLQAAGRAGVVVTGPVEEDWPLTPADLPPGVTRLAAPPLSDLLALLAGARAYAGNDSGPGHLAAALGVPTLTLFGPSDPGVWAPRGPGPTRVVQGDLDGLSVEQVLPAWLALLEHLA